MWKGTAASWVNLHPPGAIESEASGAHGGRQVGWVQRGDTGLTNASIWRGTAESWVSLHPAHPDALWSRAFGTDGAQQVGYVTLFPNLMSRAALWRGTADSWVDLNPLPTVRSVAFGAGDGQQVGRTERGLRWFAALWSGTAASWVDLHPPAAHKSTAIDAAGGVQAGWVQAVVDGQLRATLWRGTAVSRVDLHPPGAVHSIAAGTHLDWQVGWVEMPGSVRRAAIWNGTADSLQLLPMPFGSQSSGASSVWTDGLTLMVAGWSTRPDGTGEGAVLWTRPIGANISGTVGLGGWTAPLTDPLVTIEVRAPGSTTALQTAVVSLSAAGEFTFTTPLPAGTYDVTAKSDRWLRARLQNVTFTAAGASGLAFGELIPGDVVEDNAVDLADFLALAATYEASPPTEARADLNGDGAVDLADFLLLAANYETVGAP
jgi:hypothetical protein